MKFIPNNLILISRITSSISLIYFGSILLESYKHQAWLAFALAFVYGGFAVYILVNAGNRVEIIEVETIKNVTTIETRERLIHIFEQSLSGEKSFLIPNGQPCVYLLQDITGTGHCKIGLSSNLNERIGKLRTSTPVELRVIHIVKTFQPKELEKALHNRFARKRLNGEWFDLSQDDVDYIKSL